VQAVTIMRMKYRVYTLNKQSLINNIVHNLAYLSRTKREHALIVIQLAVDGNITLDFTKKEDICQEIKHQLETGQLETVQLETGQLETVQLETGQLDTGQLETGQLETGQLDTGQLETVQLETGQLETGQLETVQLETGQNQITVLGILAL